MTDKDLAQRLRHLGTYFDARHMTNHGDDCRRSADRLEAQAKNDITVADGVLAMQKEITRWETAFREEEKENERLRGALEKIANKNEQTCANGYCCYEARQALANGG